MWSSGKKGGEGGETTRSGGDGRAGTSSEIKRGLKWNEQEERGRTEVKGDTRGNKHDPGPRSAEFRRKRAKGNADREG